MRRRLPAVIAAAALLAAAALQGHAHANLVKSVPDVGAVLASFPTTVEMEFSEDVNPASVGATLLDGHSAVVATGTVTAMSSRVVHVAIPSQPDGAYGLSWQVRSSLDGHATVGTLAFSVGASAPLASLLPPVGTPDPLEQLPAPLEAALRAVGYVALALVLGAGLFGAISWRPAFRQLGAGLDSWDERAVRILLTALRVGAVGTALSVIGLVVVRIAQTGGGGAPASLWRRATQGLSAREAVLLGLRLAAALVVLAVAGSKSAQRGAWAWWATSAAGAFLVASFSLASHNAATGLILPVVADFFHASAMSAWIGGIVPFGLLLYRSTRIRDEGAGALLIRVVQRFSRVAFTSVMIIGLTGLYMTYLQVRGLDPLLHARYGQAVLVKVGLFGVLFAFGAVNELWIMPQMSRAALPAFGRFVRTVSTESVLAVMVLATAGMLTCCTPAYIASEEQRRLGYHERFGAGPVRVDLRIAPASAGDNELGVDVVDRRGGAAAVPATVLLRVDMGGEGVTEVKTAPLSGGPATDGRFTARGSYLSMEGTWRVNVILRKPGYNDVTHAFAVVLPLPPVRLLPTFRPTS